MFGETPIFNVMIWSHPIETTILTWTFRIPGTNHVTFLSSNKPRSTNCQKTLSSSQAKLSQAVAEAKAFAISKETAEVRRRSEGRERTQGTKK